MGECVQGSSLTGSTRQRFSGPGAHQSQADRINVLHGLEHGSVVGVEPPQPGVVNLRGAESIVM